MRYVYAAASCAASTVEGLNLSLTQDEAWDADDPFVKHRPDLFTDEPTYPRRTVAPVEPTVEQATAAPGERRNVRRG